MSRLIIKKLKHYEKCEDCGKKAEYEIIEDMVLYPLTYYLCRNCLRKNKRIIDYEEYDEYSYLNVMV